jgi:hypothetical protein
MLASGGHSYRLTGTGFTQFGESGRTAEVEANGSLMDVTNPMRPVLVDGSVRVRLVLQSGTGSSAGIEISVLRSDSSLALAAGWDGTQPVTVPLLAGQINVS